MNPYDNSSMLFSQIWKVENPAALKTQLRQIVLKLENQGCLIEEDSVSARWTVFYPGLDQWVLARLMNAPGFSSVTGNWIQVVQKLFWDRAEIEMDEKSREIRYRWVYWSPVQIFMHSLFSVFAICSGKFMESVNEDASFSWVNIFAILCVFNLIPYLISLADSSRIKANLRA
jgi:hypothetical protein